MKVDSFSFCRSLSGAALSVALIACSTPGQGIRDPRGQESPSGQGITIALADKPVVLPAFNLTDLEGHPIDRADWAEKVVLLNFWATWCGPCRQEIPDLVALQERYRDSLVVIGLSVDEAPAADVRRYVQGQHVNYPITIVGDAIQDQFDGIGTVPSTFVVNRDGRLTQRHIGLLNAQQIEQEVRVLSGLPTAATVTWIPNLGQHLLRNPKYETDTSGVEPRVDDLPAVDLPGLSPASKAEALKQMNSAIVTRIKEKQ